MFINDNDVGTDCAEPGEHTDVWAVKEQGTSVISTREVERKKGKRESVRVLQRNKKRRSMRVHATAAMMCMRKGDSERQGERV